jgi:hypothetical protein
LAEALAPAHPRHYPEGLARPVDAKAGGHVPGGIAGLPAE